MKRLTPMGGFRLLVLAMLLTIVGCGGIGNAIADIQRRDMGDGTVCYILAGGTGASASISCLRP